MYKTILKQGIEGSLGYFANGKMLVSSPIYKTRSKQGIVKKCGDRYYVSKTIAKEGIEGSVGYCFNGPMGVTLPMSKTR